MFIPGTGMVDGHVKQKATVSTCLAIKLPSPLAHTRIRYLAYSKILKGCTCSFLSLKAAESWRFARKRLCFEPESTLSELNSRYSFFSPFCSLHCMTRWMIPSVPRATLRTPGSWACPTATSRLGGQNGVAMVEVGTIPCLVV